MDSRISVSLAMFDRSHRKISYDVADMGTKTWVPKEKNIVDAEFPPLTTVFGDTSGSKKTLELNDEGAIYPMHCMGQAVIGVSNTIARLHAVKKMLVDVGYKDAAISYLGGLSVLITFHDSIEMADFMVSRKDVWEQALISVSPWTGQSLPFERIVVLKVVGMPVFVRDNVVFDKVGTLFGEVVWPSVFSWTGIDNSVGFTHVLTKIAARIDEEVTVYWKGNGYTVWVVEESSTWVPEFEAVNVEDKDDEMEEGEIRDVSSESDETTLAGNIPVNNSSLNPAENQEENLHVNEDFPSMVDTTIPAQHSNCVGQTDTGSVGVGQGHGFQSNEFVGNSGMGFNMGCFNSVKSRKRPRLVFNNSPEDNYRGVRT
ncbi:hypothetical protein HanPI659440_Chr13g0483031 [Helianthus annuus]|nr:hypothetical protein HanPI659440_Chr13g0483031 [Helianthus annuus]